MPTESPALPLPEALTPREAAELLRVHVRTLERKAAAGERSAPYRSGRVAHRRTLIKSWRTFCGPKVAIKSARRLAVGGDSSGRAFARRRAVR